MNSKAVLGGIHDTQSFAVLMATILFSLAVTIATVAITGLFGPIGGIFAGFVLGKIGDWVTTDIRQGVCK